MYQGLADSVYTKDGVVDWYHSFIDWLANEEKMPKYLNYLNAKLNEGWYLYHETH